MPIAAPRSFALPLAACIGLLTAPPTSAQSFTTATGGALAQDGVGVLPTAEGFLVAGRAFTGTGHRPLLWSFDASGALVGTHDVDLPGRVFLQAMATIPAGGAYLVGSVIDPGSHEHDGLVVRINPDGTVAWIHHPDVPGDQQYLGATVMPDGGPVVCGVSRTATGKDALLARFGPLGEAHWTTIEDYGVDEELLAVAASATGIMGTGRVMNFGGTSDALFIGYALAGDATWVSSWGGAEDEIGRALIARADGSFVMAGGTKSYGPMDQTEGRIKEQVYLIALDDQGDTLWTRVQGDTIADRQAYCLAQAANGDLLIGGERYTGAVSDGLLQRLNAGGALLWERTMDTGREEKLLDIRALPTGLVATGWSFGPDSRQVLLTRRNANGD